jgi:hypothetical protein
LIISRFHGMVTKPLLVRGYRGPQARETRKSVGTRYAALLVRTFVDPSASDDLAAANAVQDAIRLDQSTVGSFEIPNWDERPSPRCWTRSCGSDQH